MSISLEFSDNSFTTLVDFIALPALATHAPTFNHNFNNFRGSYRVQPLVPVVILNLEVIEVGFEGRATEAEAEALHSSLWVDKFATK